MVYGKLKKGKEEKIWQSDFVVGLYYFSKLVTDISGSTCEQKLGVHEKKTNIILLWLFNFRTCRNSP